MVMEEVGVVTRGGNVPAMEARVVLFSWRLSSSWCGVGWGGGGSHNNGVFNGKLGVIIIIAG